MQIKQGKFNTINMHRKYTWSIAFEDGQESWAQLFKANDVVS